MRIALAQMNSVVGDFTRNGARILEFSGKAASEGAELVVFPELALSSYPCLDLLDRPDYCAAHDKALRELVTALAGAQGSATVIMGAFIPNDEPRGRLLRNTVLVVQKGKIVYTQAKQLLPTYDVFDENRYFEPGAAASPWKGFAPATLGLAVCEDSWFEELHTGRILYEHDPATALKGCALAINVSASPFMFGKQKSRDHVLSGFARRVGAPLVYVNQVGANDEILFDGDSRFFGADGELLVQAPAFLEGLLVLNVDGGNGQVQDPRFFLKEAGLSMGDEAPVPWQNAPALLTLSPKVTFSSDPRTQAAPGKLRAVAAPAAGAPTMVSGALGRSTLDSDPQKEMRTLARGLEAGIRDYFKKSGFKTAILGLSGGIDSAVVATLAARALGSENVFGYSLPSKYSSSHSIEDAQSLAEALGIHYGAASIKFVNSALLMELKNHFKGAPEDETEENLQSRLRGVILMAIANKKKALALATGNKSELAVGYCTLYGDMCGALAPLGDLYKTRVYELAHYLNLEGAVIPQSSLTKPPSAELRPHQTDQDTLPPYELLDGVLEAHIERGEGEETLVSQGVDPQVVAQVLSLVRRSEFKRRQAPLVLKVSPKAFGMGRRYPIVRGF